MNNSPTLLHELQNNEAILLMYLANELPAQDRAEVEHMLDRDEGLRLELSQVQALYSGYHGVMRELDAGAPRSSAIAAARAVGDVLRAKQPDPDSVDDHEEPRRRVHWIAYPIAVAAALAIGMFMWWQSARDDLSKPSDVMARGNYDPTFGDGWRGPDMDAMQDTQIVRMFDSVVPERDSDLQNQLSAIKFLQQSVQ